MTLRHRLALASLALALAAPAALAAGTSTKFEPAAEVRGTRLQLNGAGTRFKAIFRVYDMALYTTKKVGTAEELLALPGAKRLSFVALRDIPGTDLGRLFVKGLAENSPEDQVRKHTVSTTRFIEIFSGRSKLVAGDTFAMEFVPGKGTQFFIVGQPQGEPVGDDEFFQMVLKIWVGGSPADRMLKDALLGGDKP
ncbi:MAG TPA: chalcone isomerase family protein [Albitalea sp.]|uniref:chalcone isomerase family protein n=1 Tax=Piscinibacter sp. TaxID=1903157 RepID=UPI002ED5480D